MPAPAARRAPVGEVQRPRRRDRRARKSDRIDALAAAKSVLTEERVSAPRRRGVLTAIRALLIARRSAVAERTRVLNQLQALNATAPTSLRERIGDGTGKQLERRILSMRARPNADIEERVAFAVMRDLAAHSRTLGADAKRYQHQLADLVSTLDDTLLDEAGIGPISAAKLLACDPSRFKNEAAFARCNGTAPIPASSGKTVRYRLNPGGDRQANNAIHTIAIIRAKHQPQTRAYSGQRVGPPNGALPNCGRSNRCSSGRERAKTRGTAPLAAFAAGQGLASVVATRAYDPHAVGASVRWGLSPRFR